MSRGQRWIVGLLVCSLGINLLLVGGIIGRMMSGGPPPRPMPGHVGWIVRQLDDDRRQEVREDMMSHFRTTRPLRRDIGEAQRAFEAAVAADEFDRARTLEALARLREAQQTWQRSTHEQMVMLLERLDAEERARVAGYLARPSRRMRPGPPPHEDGPEGSYERP